MAIYQNPMKKNKFTVSYTEREVEKIPKMEFILMDAYGLDRSALHKFLIKEKYRQHTSVL